MEAFATVRGTPADNGSPGRFVVGRVDVDRRANRDEDEDE
jgi:hypothetical protein